MRRLGNSKLSGTIALVLFILFLFALIKDKHGYFFGYPAGPKKTIFTNYRNNHALTANGYHTRL